MEVLIGGNRQNAKKQKGKRTEQSHRDRAASITEEEGEEEEEEENEDEEDRHKGYYDYNVTFSSP